MKKLRMMLITLALLLLSTQAAFADVAFGPGAILLMLFIRYGYIAVIVVVGILLYRYIRKNRNAFEKPEKADEKDQ
jgi:hypothetical protein